MTKNSYIGEVYGKLTVLKELPKHIYPSGGTRRKFLVHCSCGTKPFQVVISSLRNGDTKSCGCLNHLGKHKMSNTPTYRSWANMIKRCRVPTCKAFKHYGGRGISVCDRWDVQKGGSFENFLEDVGIRKTGKDLDRIDVNGNYTKENCRWATRNVQNFNKRKSQPAGIFFHINKWQVHLKTKGKTLNLGRFLDFNKALEARKQAELKIYGETKIA